MRTLTKTLAASAAAVALAVFATSASAAIFVNNWSINPTTGEITVTFGDGRPDGVSGLPFGGIGDPNSSGIAGDHGTTYTHTYNSGTGAFTDTFGFFLPTGTVINAAISTSNLVFTGISFNGIGGSVSNSPGLHIANVGGVPVAEGGPQNLIITGNGVPTSGWTGTATFTPAPEPMAWALMILGFAGAGAMLRNRRRLAIAG